MENCDNYKIKLINFFFPPLYEFGQLCESFDKTKMFITILIRSIIYGFILELLFMYNIISNKKNDGDIKLILFIIFLVIFLSNILSLIISIFRKQRYPKIEKIIIKEETEFVPKSYFKSLEKLDKRYMCPVSKKITNLYEPPT